MFLRSVNTNLPEHTTLYVFDHKRREVLSRDQNAGWSHNMRIDNRSFERVEEFKYLGTTITNQNSIQVQIKSRMKSGNACYYSVQNLLSSSLLTKNLNIKIYRTIILHVVLYGCETWSLTLRGNICWGCLRIGCCGEYLGLRRKGQQGFGGNYIMRSLMICTAHQVVFEW